MHNAIRTLGYPAPRVVGRCGNHLITRRGQRSAAVLKATQAPCDMCRTRSPWTNTCAPFSNPARVLAAAAGLQPLPPTRDDRGSCDARGLRGRRGLAFYATLSVGPRLAIALTAASASCSVSP